MAIKKTLLEIVQSILSDMDSEDINSLSDTIEAEQVARIVESTYYNIISTRDIPEHQQLIKLTALSDSSFPTHFVYPENTKDVQKVWYDTSDDDSFKYTEIKWKDPVEFLYLSDRIESNYVSVDDKNAGTNLRVTNNAQPTYWTTFDDYHIVMNAYDATIDTTLTSAKSRAFGTVYPEFSLTDDHVPDIDGVMFPYLIAEAKSTAFSLLKGGSDPKIEQAARRQKSYIQNDMYRNKRPANWSTYGRS
jgi:hypothetical protein